MKFWRSLKFTFTDPDPSQFEYVSSLGVCTVRILTCLFKAVQDGKSVSFVNYTSACNCGLYHNRSSENRNT